MKKVFKAVALFIGTVVGAGFASGKEVAVYFNGLSPLTTIISGLFLGFFCSLFMLSGKKNFLFYPKWFKVVTFFCSVITMSAMCAGAENVIRPLFPFGGLLLTALSIIVAVLGMKQVKAINAIIVPAIVVGIFLLFFKNGELNLSGSFLPFKPISYAALNLLIAGNLMADLGKEMSNKEIVASGIASAVVMSAMLFCLGAVVIGKNGEMPLLDVAINLGFKAVAIALVLFAIFTTMVSSAKLIIDDLTLLTKSKTISFFACLVLCYPLSLVGFEHLITYGYPLVSLFGLIQLAMTLIKALHFKPNHRRHYRRRHKNTLKRLRENR